MKKLLIVTLAILCVACMCIALAACDEKHQMGEWIEETAATCTENGVVGHYHCTHCDKDFDRDGNEISDLTIPKLGHVRHEEVTKKATCTEEGVRLVSCERGGMSRW